ncbi:unnamed protein product [Caenorhabditis auriculariae]|uniref:Dynein light chain n=1 Tax=Caenorhabditis auriculariae TaxID=2777116 RepID=A0A8S1GVI7_9PELO|nr:unnamed protein product [Caenorhabditis auriculariae]
MEREETAQNPKKKDVRPLSEIPEELSNEVENESPAEERRKSFQKSRSNAEKSLPKKQEGVIKSSDMAEEMQREAVRVATEAMEKYRLEKDMATYIKRRVRPETQPFMALRRRKKFWILCYT